MEIRDKFLSVENVTDNDIITFLDAGSIEVGKFGDKYNFKVSRGSYEQIWTPDALARKELVKHFGRDTEKWVGKQVVLSIIPNTNNKIGKSVYPKPLIVKV